MRIAIISDIHGNYPAWSAVENDLKRLNIDAIIAAGDYVGHYYCPSKVVARLMNCSNLYAIRGNHEDIFQRFRDEPAVRPDLREKYGHGFDVALETLTMDQQDWLSKLPHKLKLDLDGRRIVVRHSTLNDQNGYLYPDAPLAAFEAALEEQADLTVYGHTHHPLVWSAPGKGMIVNPGSIGQPRDIGGLASYAIYQTGSGTIQLVRSEFETKSTMDAVEIRDPLHPTLKTVLSRRRL